MPVIIHVPHYQVLVPCRCRHYLLPQALSAEPKCCQILYLRRRIFMYSSNCFCITSAEQRQQKGYVYEISILHLSGCFLLWQWHCVCLVIWNCEPPSTCMVNLWQSINSILWIASGIDDCSHLELDTQVWPQYWLWLWLVTYCSSNDFHLICGKNAYLWVCIVHQRMQLLTRIAWSL